VNASSIRALGLTLPEAVTNGFLVQTRLPGKSEREWRAVFFDVAEAVLESLACLSQRDSQGFPMFAEVSIWETNQGRPEQIWLRRPSEMTPWAVWSC
jgi:hypothetical protein